MPKKRSYSKKSRKTSNKKRSHLKKKSYLKKSRKNSYKKVSKKNIKKGSRKYKGGSGRGDRMDDLPDDYNGRLADLDYGRELLRTALANLTYKQQHCTVIQKLYNIRAQLANRGIRPPEEPYFFYFDDHADPRYIIINQGLTQQLNSYLLEYPWLNPDLEMPNSPFWYNMRCNENYNIY